MLYQVPIHTYQATVLLVFPSFLMGKKVLHYFGFISHITTTSQFPKIEKLLQLSCLIYYYFKSKSFIGIHGVQNWKTAIHFNRIYCQKEKCSAEKMFKAGI